MRLIAPLLAIVLCAFSAGAALADDRSDDDNRRAARGHHADRNHPNNDAANRARQQYPGARVLSVQPTDDGRHRVKVLKDGEVHIVTDPPPEKNR
jgi:hypothetical protein